MRRHYWIPGITVVAILIFAVGHVSFASNAKAEGVSSATEVKIDNFTFEPQTLTVKAGTTITWTNRDDIPHTVVSTDFVFKSKALDTDDSFKFTPTKPGTYSYFCSIHPKMTGRVVVQ